MKKTILILFLVAVLAVASVGCTKNDTPEVSQNNDKINIVATIFPQYDFARAIVQDKANLTMLVSPGASIHSFDPSPADIKKIDGADVFIYIGGDGDAWVERILNSVDLSNKKIIRLMDYVQAVEEEEIGEEEEPADEPNTEVEYDEHIWTSPQNAIKLISAISDCLCDADSKNADAYRTNAEAYINNIQKLDTEIKDVIKDGKRDEIVVADKFPFRYFVDEFGLRYCAAFSGCSDQTDASAKTIASLVDTVKEQQIPYIYYVELSNKNVAEAISQQTGAKMLLLHSCQNVSRAEFDEGATYLSLMKQNVENLRKGLN